MSKHAPYYQGRRFSYDGALCTLRYYGPLAGKNGEWLGVEWDDPARGKHDGRYEGQQLFKCLSKSPIAGSFLRPTRKAGAERTLLEAIRHKYGSGSQSEAASEEKWSPGRYESIEISGKVVEEVGFERIQKQLAALTQLRIVLVDELVINGIAPRDSPGEIVHEYQADLASQCPNIEDLDVGWNVIEKWADVARMCQPLRKLSILKAR